MIRQDHIFYDLHALLGSPRFLIGGLVVLGFVILYVDFRFVYPAIFLFAGLLAVRAFIGRRCPECDGVLKEEGAERDKADAFVMHIIWRCPRDGYQETERVKGDSGLFGAN